jgi:FKBP-type peptidyl-prolyl cis-trans isomerase 2
MRKAEKNEGLDTEETGQKKTMVTAEKKRQPKTEKKGSIKSGTEAEPSDMQVGERAVETGDRVTVHYAGTLDDGEVFDTADGKNPLIFTLGSKQVFPVLEYSVLGMKIGETKKIRLKPIEAFGPWMETAVITVERMTFPADEEIVVGKKAKVAYSGGSERVMRVMEVTDTSVKLDGNHPLAGLYLNYDLKLAAIE